MNEEQPAYWEAEIREAKLCKIGTDASPCVECQTVIAADKHIRDLEEQVERLQLVCAWRRHYSHAEGRLDFTVDRIAAFFSWSWQEAYDNLHRYYREAAEAGCKRLEEGK